MTRCQVSCCRLRYSSSRSPGNTNPALRSAGVPLRWDAYRRQGKEKRKTVYFRGKDKHGHRIKIIRDKESRIGMNKKFYSAIADGLIVRGNLIKDNFGIVRFHVIVRYNPSDVREISDAYKEYEEYINKEKEINIDNGVCSE